MNFVRESELYISKRLGRALSFAAKKMDDSTITPESLAEKFIAAGLESEFPGVLKVVDDCESAYEVTRRHNQDLFNQWKGQLK